MWHRVCPIRPDDRGAGGGILRCPTLLPAPLPTLPVRPLLLVLGALVPLLAACDAVGPVNEPPPPPPVDPAGLVALLDANGRFGVFADVAAETGLEAATASGATTTLAPDDEAFALMSPESLDGLRSQPGVLDKLARRHVVTVAVDPAALADGDVLPTLEGTPLTVRVDDEGTVFVGGARLGAQVGRTASGPVYRLERVLRDHLSVAERLGASPLLARSASLFALAGVDLSRPGTYLVPINVGYDQALGGYGSFTRAESRALLAKTLQALVIPGERLSAAELRQRGTVQTAGGSALAVEARDGFTVLGRGESRIVVADVPAGQATVHLIDVPPQGHLTILERVRFASTLSSFATLLGNAGLTATLSGAGPYTVFAPTEAGFDSLGTRGRTAVLTEAPLRDLLARFHVVPGDVPSSGLTPGRDLATLSDQTIPVRPDPARGGLTVVARAAPVARLLDVPAANGRLHVTQSLLNPQLRPFDQLALAGFGAFRAVVEATGYRGLLESGAALTVAAPLQVNDQFFRPGFECRARQLVEDHVGRGAVQYTPRTGGFNSLGGAFVRYASPERFGLQEGETTVGGSDVLYVNRALGDGGVLHGALLRLRWYASSGHAQNLPPCTG